MVSTDTIDVTYYNRKDREGVSWTSPFDDTSEPVTTPKEHVIFRNITVSYVQTRVLRCSIDKETIKEINRSFADHILNME